MSYPKQRTVGTMTGDSDESGNLYPEIDARQLNPIGSGWGFRGQGMFAAGHAEKGIATSETAGWSMKRRASGHQK